MPVDMISGFKVENMVDRLEAWVLIYGIKVISALLILFCGWLVARGLQVLLRRVLRRGHVDGTLISFISSLSYVALMAFVIIAALGQLGIQTASFVAVIGAAGLAVGLALQGSLSNFASGVLMIIFKPFKIGDFIEGGGATGVVEEVGIFTTELKSPDNKKIIVPNGKMTGDNIVNYTAREIRRVDIEVGVSYGDNLDKVKKAIDTVMKMDSRILAEPAPQIAVGELGESSVNFVVRPWVKTADYWDVKFATQENLKKQFDAEGISIPFPQRDVHLYKAD
jgi:small conductance mechanosensitive channel